MERTPHVLLAGPGANKFAEEQGVPRLPPGSLVTPSAQMALDEFKKTGTILTEIGGKDFQVRIFFENFPYFIIFSEPRRCRYGRSCSTRL